MRVVTGEGRRGPAIASTVFVTGLVALAVSVFSSASLLGIAVFAIAATLFAMTHERVLQWKTLLGLLIAVILFVPIRRYNLPAALPFKLELYRLLVVVVVAFWLTSLLIDPRVRLRRSGLEGPLYLILLAALVSDVLNTRRISEDQVGSFVVKSLTFFVSFLLVFYVAVSIGRRWEYVLSLLKLLVAGAAAVGFLAVIESRTQYNVFDHLHSVLPFLHPSFTTATIERYGQFRAWGPAEHPIALSAALAMVVPIGAYLAKATGHRRWWFAVSGLILGVLATHSRTGVVMLLVELFVLVVLWPAKARRLWPLLLPALLIVHFAAPGTIGSLKASFFPKGGLVQEQRGYKDSGRVGDIAPTFREISSEPLFGKGFGTRVIDPRLASDGTTILWPNARILDDQWLATLLEVGVVGAFGWVWLFARMIRRLYRAAKDEEEAARAWLWAAFLASVCAYAAGMSTYDAFGFIQVTFLFYLLLAFACALLPPMPHRSTSPVALPVPAR